MNCNVQLLIKRIKEDRWDWDNERSILFYLDLNSKDEIIIML